MADAAMRDLKRSALDELQRRRAELTALCSGLIQIPSENPPGDTTKLAAFIRGHLEERGIEPAVYEPRPGRPNLVATLGRGTPNLVLAGHMDEFPAGGGWTLPPFSGEIRGGRLYGRGAGDMKGGVAVALVAATLVKELRVPLRGSLTLAFMSDEETGGTWGTQWLLENVEAVRGDACLIGESSGTWSIGVGEKGVLWLRLTATGVSGHAAYALGESAVTKILRCVDAIARLHGTRVTAGRAIAAMVRDQRAAAEKHWGPGTGRIADRVTVNVGALRGGGQVNLIPERCEADIDFRVPPGMTTMQVLRAVRQKIKETGVRGVTVEILNQCECHVTSPKAKLVTLVRENARALCRLDSLPVLRLGYTDGRFFRRAGIPTVVFGPRVHGMGGPDEYVEERELFDVAKVHLGVVLDYVGA